MLAIGCGSLFFSHVNDAGFWLVKEYFGLTVGQTIRSWSVMETAISVVGFVFVMAGSVSSAASDRDAQAGRRSGAGQRLDQPVRDEQSRHRIRCGGGAPDVAQVRGADRRG